MDAFERLNVVIWSSLCFGLNARSAVISDEAVGLKTLNEIRSSDQLVKIKPLVTDRASLLLDSITGITLYEYIL